MSSTHPITEKELPNGDMSGASTQTPSELEDEKQTADSPRLEVEAEADDLEDYATGVALYLIAIGLGLGVFLVALDMV